MKYVILDITFFYILLSKAVLRNCKKKKRTSGSFSELDLMDIYLIPYLFCMCLAEYRVGTQRDNNLK